MTTVSDENFFGAATREFSLGVADENLLAKARVLAGGDEKGTEFEYIKLRVEQLKSEKRNHVLRSVAGSAGAEISSVGNALQSCFSRVSRNHVIGIAAFCIVGIIAASLFINEVNGTCTRFRLAKVNYQEWIGWIDDQGIDIQDMRTAPYGYLVNKYGQVANQIGRGNFYRSEREFEAAKNRLNFTGFCFSQ